MQDVLGVLNDGLMCRVNCVKKPMFFLKLRCIRLLEGWYLHEYATATTTIRCRLAKFIYAKNILAKTKSHNDVILMGLIMKLFNQYVPAPKPVNETERLAALVRYEILDTEFEQHFDDLAQLAAHICGTPIALISLVESDRQWFKSHIGLDVTETPRDIAFCPHAILQPNQTFIVSDAHQDPRFANSPLVTAQPFVRFYAGAPLVTAEGYALGTLCVIDSIPRDLMPQQIEALQALSRQVMAQLELRRNLIQLNQTNLQLTRLNQNKNDFLNMAAHDLKNPLSAIKGYAEEIMEMQNNVDTEEVGEIAKNIAKASQHMFELVINLLDVNAIEHQMDNLKCEPINIAEILSHLKTQYQQRAALKQIELNLQIDSQRLAYAHAASVQQIFDNLISNALKYSPFGSASYDSFATA
jgi:signal transduction histidine kinase